MTIKSNEEVLQGAWRVVNGKMQADETTQRIESLVHGYLKKIGADESGWDVLYVDPSDGRFWELVYLESESHGGGPPTLRHVTEAQAREKYATVLRA